MTPQKLDRIRKKLHKFFKDFDLKITVETGLKQVDFLDVSFNLNDGSFKPYRKPNDNPLYINKDSNHPKHIIHNIPKAINKRLSEISSSKQMFDEGKCIYQNALDNSGYTFTLQYNDKAADRKLPTDTNVNTSTDCQHPPPPPQTLTPRTGTAFPHPRPQPASPPLRCWDPAWPRRGSRPSPR